MQQVEKEEELGEELEEGLQRSGSSIRYQHQWKEEENEEKEEELGEELIRANVVVVQYDISCSSSCSSREAG